MSKLPQEELLSAYLDGELSAAERADVEKLLSDDASARAMLEELRGVSSAVKGMPTFKLDEDLGVRVLKIAERRMLADSPAADTTSSSSLEPAPSLKSATGPFWRTVRRRFLTPRAIAWSATVAAVAILLTVYAPEEEKHGPKSPIAMDMETDGGAPADHVVADGRARRGPGEFRAAPLPAAEKSAAAVAKKESKTAPPTPKAAPAKITEKPALKRPDAVRRLAAKSGPVETYRKAIPRKGGPGMAGGMGGGMGMAAEAPLAEEGLGDWLKRKSGLIDKSAINAEAESRASSLKREPPTITINCYYVSSPSVAQKTLEKILLSQKTPSNKQLLEPSALKWEKPKEKQIALQKTVETESETISLEATPAQLEQMLADIRKQSDVFRDCSDDAKSQRHAFGLRQNVAALKSPSAPAGPKAESAPRSQSEPKPMQQQAARPAQTLDAPPKMPPASDESTNYRVVFVLQSSKLQPAAAPNASAPAKK